MTQTPFIRAGLLALVVAAAATCGGEDGGPPEAGAPATGATGPGVAAGPAAAPDVDPEISPELADRVSYKMGHNWGLNFRDEEFDYNEELLLEGLHDALAGEEGPYSQPELNEAMDLFRQKLKVRRNLRRERLAAENAAEGPPFLERNAGRPEVVVLPSGLQYEVLASGSGPSPGPGDRVTVHYRGWFVDGTQFDSSYDRGRPNAFTLDRVIEGWQQALTRMRVGDRWKLYIPAELGYGDRGSGKIAPNATLIYELELLAVEPAAS